MTCERPTSDRDLGLFDRNPEGVSFWQLLKEDYRTHESEFFSQGFWAIAVHRFGNWRMGIRSRLLRLPFSVLYKLLVKCVEWFCGISLNYTVILGRRVRIWHQGGMVLGALSIGNGVHIRQNVPFGANVVATDVPPHSLVTSQAPRVRTLGVDGIDQGRS